MLSSWMSLPFTHVRKRLFLSRRSALSSHEFQLFFHVCSTDLGVANGGLDGWGPFHGHMPQIIGDLFQRPPSLAGTMRKIVAQIMKREVSDQLHSSSSPRSAFAILSPLRKRTFCAATHHLGVRRSRNSKPTASASEYPACREP